MPLDRDTLADAPAASVTLGIRPENLRRRRAAGLLEVDVVEELGADAYVYGRAKTHNGNADVVARIDPLGAHRRRAPRCGWFPDHARVLVFDADTGERLS